MGSTGMNYFAEYENVINQLKLIHSENYKRFREMIDDYGLYRKEPPKGTVENFSELENSVWISAKASIDQQYCKYEKKAQAAAERWKNKQNSKSDSDGDCPTV